MNNYANIQAVDLHNLLAEPNNEHNIVLVDVRNDDEVARGIIAGAIHIQLSMLPVQFQQLTHAQTVIFYCHSGVRSAHAADFAAGKGLKDVYNLTGGVLAWGKAGFVLVPSK